MAMVSQGSHGSSHPEQESNSLQKTVTLWLVDHESRPDQSLVFQDWGNQLSASKTVRLRYSDRDAMTKLHMLYQALNTNFSLDELASMYEASRILDEQNLANLVIDQMVHFLLAPWCDVLTPASHGVFDALVAVTEDWNATRRLRPFGKLFSASTFCAEHLPESTRERLDAIRQCYEQNANQWDNNLVAAFTAWQADGCVFHDHEDPQSRGCNLAHQGLRQLPTGLLLTKDGGYVQGQCHGNHFEDKNVCHWDEEGLEEGVAYDLWAR